ncbi:MAG: type III secretion system chaperone [Ramlibacter sp.]
MSRLLDSEIVGARLVDAAGACDLIDSVTQVNDELWVVEVEGEVPCLAELEPDRANLTFSADVGTPAEDRQNEARGAALSYNALWRETGGARVAQAGAGGELILVRQFAANIVDDPEFSASVEHFIRVAGWWKAFVSHAGEGRKPDPVMDFFGMRV